MNKDLNILCIFIHLHYFTFMHNFFNKSGEEVVLIDVRNPGKYVQHRGKKKSKKLKEIKRNPGKLDMNNISFTYKWIKIKSGKT